MEGSVAIWVGLGLGTVGDDEDGVVVGQVADASAESAVEGWSLGYFEVELGYERGWVVCLGMVALEEDVAVVG